MQHTFSDDQLKKMLFAAFITMIIMILSDLTDNILAAQLFGAMAMAGVNLTNPLLCTATFITLMIATGTTYLYSFEIGAFRPKVANRLAGQGIAITLCLCVIVAVALLLGEDAYFSCFPNAKETVDFARDYFSLYWIVLSIMPLFFFLQMIVYSDGGGTNCVFAIVTQFAVHLIASVFFASYMEMGMSGLALGSFLGIVAAMIVFCKWFFFDSKTLKPELYFSLNETVKVVKCSYVHASIYLHVALGNMFLNTFFLHKFGEEYFPILSVITGLLQLAVCFDGLGQAAEPIVNIYLGEKNYNGVEKVMRSATKYAVILGTATIPCLILFAAYIARAFGITEPRLLADSATAIRILSFSMPFLSVLYLYATYYQIIGYVRIAVLLSVCKDLVLYVALPIGLALSFNLFGMWLGMMLAPIMTCLLFIAFLRLRYKETFPFLLPKTDILSRDAYLSTEKAIELRDWAENEYKKRGFNTNLQMKVGLLIEEVCVDIVENNKGMKILTELTLFFDNEPRIIIRDNGKRLDMTQDAINSFRDYFIYSFIHTNNFDNKFLITQNYNRHIFKII